MRVHREIQIPLVQESVLKNYLSVHGVFTKNTESVTEYLKSNIRMVAGFNVVVIVALVKWSDI